MGNKGTKGTDSSVDVEAVVSITPISHEVKQVTFENFLQEFADFVSQNKVTDERGMPYEDVTPYLLAGLQKARLNRNAYELSLSNKKIGDPIFARMTDCFTMILKSMSHIRASQDFFHRTVISYPISTIILKDCKLTVKSVPKIFYLLYNETILPLTSLDLSYNLFDDEAGPPLLDALNTNKTLKNLDLSSNRFASLTHTALAKILSLNQTLESVNLSSNLGNEQNMKVVVNSLKSNTSMRQLKLDYHVCSSPALEDKMKYFTQRNEAVSDIVRRLVDSSIQRALSSKARPGVASSIDHDLHFAPRHTKEHRNPVPKTSNSTTNTASSPNASGSSDAGISSSDTASIYSATYSPRPTKGETANHQSILTRRTKQYGPAQPASTVLQSDASASRDSQPQPLQDTPSSPRSPRSPRAHQPKELEVQTSQTQNASKKVYAASKTKKTNPTTSPVEPPTPTTTQGSLSLSQSKAQTTPTTSTPPTIPSTFSAQLNSSTDSATSEAKKSPPTPSDLQKKKPVSSTAEHIVQSSARFDVGLIEFQGRRPAMEDCSVVYGNFRGRPDEDYFAIFDGHGGKDVSTYLSQNLHNSVIKAMTGTNDTSDALTLAFETLNQALAKRNTHCGSTAGVVLVKKETIYSANVGDTRIIFCRDGVPKRLSVDHRPSLQQESQRINGLGGQIINNRVGGTLAVTRAFGDFYLKPYVIPKPHIATQTLDFSDPSSEVIVIACDGVWDVMTDQEVASIAHKGLMSGDPNTAAKAIAEAAYQRGSPDNISVMVIEALKR